MQFPQDISHVTINGHMTIPEIVAVARYGASLTIDAEALVRMERSRAIVEEIIRTEKTTYGVNTGFGEFSKVTIFNGDIEALQRNLIVSHCCATGNPLPEEIVRAMMTLRANALCQGFSGIRPKVVCLLIDMINARICPVVPEKGSLGASGDLAPLAHMVLPMLGLGECFYQGERMPGCEALRRAGLTPVRLHAKEGLALINGTQCMTAIGLLAYYDSFRLAQTADVIAAMSMEALTALRSAFDPRVQQVRPYAGQKQVAANILQLTEGSEILAKSQNARVQDAYAIRCIPQVHGAVRDALGYVRGVLETEINAVTDNPILFPDDQAVISGGNFHGEPLALAFDFLGIAAAELADISERRLERMVNGALSNGLPPFLTRAGGLNSGYMICQYSAASMVSENKVLAHPASVDSIPSSANQEDHVSMGTTAARKARSITENTASVLAFELMAAAQGMEYRRPDQSSPVLAAVHTLVRERIPELEEDREIRIDIAAANTLVREYGILQTVTKHCGAFA